MRDMGYKAIPMAVPKSVIEFAKKKGLISDWRPTSLEKVTKPEPPAQPTSIRNFTDDQLVKKIHDDRLVFAMRGIADYYSDKAKAKFDGLSVDDRIRYLEMNAQYKTINFAEQGLPVPEGWHQARNMRPGWLTKEPDAPHEFALTDYDFNVRDKIPKEIQSDPEKLRTFLKEKGFTQPESRTDKNTNFTMHVDAEDTMQGLSPAEIDDYMKKLPGVLKKANDDHKHMDVGSVSDIPQHLLERFADDLDKITGPFKHDYDDVLQKARMWVSEFSQNYDVARDSIFSGWAMASGTQMQKIIRNLAAKAFPQNQGIEFYTGGKYETDEPKVFEDKKYSESRMIEHIKHIKQETEVYYKKKFATKKNPDPDLSQIPLEVGRGIGRAVVAYTPAAAESWTTDSRTVKRFGELMMGRDHGSWSALKAKATYADVLWTYKSAEGQSGWPPEKELKGKQEFVMLGGALTNVQVEITETPKPEYGRRGRAWGRR
jgi:hypothetical protein